MGFPSMPGAWSWWPWAQSSQLHTAVCAPAFPQGRRVAQGGHCAWAAAPGLEVSRWPGSGPSGLTGLEPWLGEEPEDP